MKRNAKVLLAEDDNNLQTENIGLQKTKRWYEKLGHASITTMKKMISSKKISDLQLEDLQNFECEACIFGKACRKSFKTCEPKICDAGDLVHSDVCGPFKTTAYNGARYFVLFKDDVTEYRYVWAIKNKSDVFEKFKEYCKIVENKFGRSIKFLKTDNGREYVNEMMNKFCKHKGIEHLTTAPFNSEQNGKAERENRTLLEMIRSMIFGRDMSKYLWAKAIQMAVFILKRTVTIK